MVNGEQQRMSETRDRGLGAPVRWQPSIASVPYPLRTSTGVDRPRIGDLELLCAQRTHFAGDSGHLVGVIRIGRVAAVLQCSGETGDVRSCVEGTLVARVVADQPCVIAEAHTRRVVGAKP